jgi:general secretion pathway protein F
MPSLRARAMQRLFEWRPLRRRLRTYFLARWYRATGMLVEGGIPLASSLALTQGLLPLGLRAGGDQVAQAVREGLSPARAHARGGMATPVAEQLLLAGERSGDLGGVLSRIAQFHEAEVSRSLERSMRALEPVVMVLIGLGVGVVVVLMYLPIFELASAIQ